MIRCVVSLMAWIALLPSANARVMPHKDFSPLRESYYPFVKQTLALTSDRPYQITEQTEVLLDGRKCKYQEVPSSAKIIEMEIDSDISRGVLRIHFQSRK